MAEVVVALLTPFTSTGDIAFDALELHTEFLISEGVTCLMPCGTTGEGTLLDLTEAAAVIARVTRVVGNRARVIAHVGRASTRQTITLAQHAIAAGASAVSAVVPYYYAYADTQIRQHYLALLHAVQARVYAYTIPDRTGNALSPDVVRDLAVAGLAGVKDSSKSMELHRQYLDCGIDVLMGSDALVLQALRLGAAGAVSAIANVEPGLLLHLAATFGEDSAAVTQAHIGALREKSRASTSAIVALKRELAVHLPDYPPHVRLPLS